MPVTSGLINAVVELVFQLKVISELMETPPPLFQLFAKKGCKNIWLTSVRFSSPANDHIWFTKKPKVKPVACFNTNTVGPTPHLRVLRKSFVPIGTRNAGPAPQINPFLLAAGEKTAYCSITQPKLVLTFTTYIMLINDWNYIPGNEVQLRAKRNWNDRLKI